MGTSIEERVFEYARGASAVGPEQTSVVIQQVIDLARGDVEILQRACLHCQHRSTAHLDKTKVGPVLALLHAAIEKTSRESEKAAGAERSERLTPMSPKLVVALALVLAEEDLHVSVAERQLLAAVGEDTGILEAARTLALEELAAGLAAGDTSTITGLSILEGACRRVHR